MSILAIDAIEQLDIIGYSAPAINPEMRLPYLGCDEEILERFSPDRIGLILGVSYTGRHVNLELRKEIIRKFENYTFCRVTARSGIIKTDSIGAGTVIFENAIVNTGSTIGSNCVINTGAIVEHHCSIGDNVQISPGAIVLGGATIGRNTFIGAGAVIRDSTGVGENMLVRMGEIVTKDIP